MTEPVAQTVETAATVMAVATVDGRLGGGVGRHAPPVQLAVTRA